MSVTDIKAEELRQKGGEEGSVFQGCGGDAKDWVDGVNQLLKDEKILLDGTKLTECYRLSIFATVLTNAISFLGFDEVSTRFRQERLKDEMTFCKQKQETDSKRH